jgi:hypothetical protein
MSSYGRRATIRRIGPKRGYRWRGAFSGRHRLIEIFYAVAHLVDVPARVTASVRLRVASGFAAMISATAHKVANPDIPNCRLYKVVGRSALPICIASPAQVLRTLRRRPQILTPYLLQFSNVPGADLCCVRTKNRDYRVARTIFDVPPADAAPPPGPPASPS